MQTLKVLETHDGWCVEQDGEVLFRSPLEDRCFQEALERSSELFDLGVVNQVTLRRGLG